MNKNWNNHDQRHPSRLTEDEQQLFRDAVSDVKPLSKSHDIIPEQPTLTEKPPEKIKKIIRKKILDEKPTFHLNEKHNTVSGDDVITYAKSGLQHKRFTQLKQGKIKTGATLDLHEHTSDEALIAVDGFLERCQQRGMRSVCIIHGKGHFSADNTPILKNLLNHYLRQHPRVLAFHSAKNWQGGTGAITVLLKARS